jgi:hypothetical protein
VKREVLTIAMMAAGYNGSHEQAVAFFQGYEQGWQRLGQLFQADPNLRARVRVSDVGAMVDALVSMGVMAPAPAPVQAQPAFAPAPPAAWPGMPPQAPAAWGMPTPPQVRPPFGPAADQQTLPFVPPPFAGPHVLPTPPGYPPGSLDVEELPNGVIRTTVKASGQAGPAHLPGVGWVMPQTQPQRVPEVVAPPVVPPAEVPPAPTSAEDVRRSIGERRDEIDRSRLESLVRPEEPSRPMTTAEIASAIAPASAPNGVDTDEQGAAPS